MSFYACGYSAGSVSFAKEDRGAWEKLAAQRTPLAPGASMTGGPFGLNEINQPKTCRSECSHIVADRAVVLDVRCVAFIVDLDIRRPVEIGLSCGKPSGPRIVRENPSHGVSDGENPATTRSKHSVHLAEYLLN